MARQKVALGVVHVDPELVVTLAAPFRLRRCELIPIKQSVSLESTEVLYGQTVHL